MKNRINLKIERTKLKLTKRSHITENVVTCSFLIDEKIQLEPGHFANFVVEEATWRSYSISDSIDNELHFLVDTKPGGPGSKFFQDAPIGTEVEVLIPMGGFLLNKTDKPKIFVATGVGIAPFKTMIKTALKSYSTQKIILLWGVRYDSEYYLEKFLPGIIGDSRVEIIPCITQTRGKVVDARKERVTAVLPTLEINFPEYELYICGNGEMVTQITQLGIKLGVKDIYTEKY